ncbi:MAG: CvpA family protein [Treponema sp.]|nr:CvpA family protein [Treponema sp.]
MILLTRILAFLILFIVVYVAIRIVQKIVGFAFQGDIMKGLDKSLGFFLGIAEGFLIVGLILFLLYSQRLFDIRPVLIDSFFDKLISPIFTTVSENIQFQGSIHV